MPSAVWADLLYFIGRRIVGVGRGRNESSDDERSEYSSSDACEGGEGWTEEDDEKEDVEEETDQDSVGTRPDRDRDENRARNDGRSAER